MHDKCNEKLGFPVLLYIKPFHTTNTPLLYILPSALTRRRHKPWLLPYQPRFGHGFEIKSLALHEMKLLTHAVSWRKYTPLFYVDIITYLGSNPGVDLYHLCQLEGSDITKCLRKYLCDVFDTFRLR